MISCLSSTVSVDSNATSLLPDSTNFIDQEVDNAMLKLTPFFMDLARL